MNKIFIKSLIESIKLNNVKQFSVLLKQEDFLRVRFGRFPLLSVLYLFNSTKIIKKYENKLITITEYETVEENFEIYQKFKQVCGRTLRIYNTESIVSPFEMLLILNQTTHLKYVYKKFKIKDENILNSLKKIEKINSNSKIEFLSQNIKFEKKPLKTFIKKAIFLSFALIFICSASAFLIANLSKKLGTESNPLYITNALQLKMAFESKNKYFKLKNNVSLSLSKSYNCSSVINGNGKTITIKASNSTIFSNFSGKFYNANLVFNQNLKNLNKSHSYFANKNNGEIKDIYLNITSELTLSSGGETIYVSAFVGENNKTISNINVLANVQVTGTQNTDSFFACCVSKNNGEISNCSVSENSIILTNTTDVCGIASLNNADGKIKNCVNFGSITQNTNASSWSPQVAGINLSNFGEILNCENKGNLKVKITSQGASGETVTEGFCAGISAINYKKIQHCKNTANIKVENTFYNFYAGGIVALNYFNAETGEISETLNCGSIGTIQLTDNTQSNSYIGGIIGCNIGNVKSCYSIIETVSTENIKIGGIVGLTHYGIGYNSVFGFIYTTTYEEWFENNYFYISNEMANKVGISDILPNTAKLTDVGMTICSTVAEIENCEVYF